MMESIDRRSARSVSRLGWIRLLLFASLVAVGVVAADAAFAASGSGPRTATELLHQRSRQGIEDRVRLAIEYAGDALEGAQVEVHAEPGGVVVLAGRVASEQARERAVRLAHYAVGVQAVDDQLEIDPSLAPKPPRTARASAEEVGSGAGSGAAAAAAPASRSSVRVASDEEVERHVARRIARDLPGDARAERGWLGGWRVAGDGWRVDVEADRGTVHLDGTVSQEIGVEPLVSSARAAAPTREVVPEVELTRERERGFFERLFYF